MSLSRSASAPKKGTPITRITISVIFAIKITLTQEELNRFTFNVFDGIEIQENQISFSANAASNG
jgi:hypothetical protein